MAFTARHRWIFSKILDSFGADKLSDSTIESFFREEANAEILNGFLRSTGPPKVFVLFQPRDVQSEVFTIRL